VIDSLPLVREPTGEIGFAAARALGIFLVATDLTDTALIACLPGPC
jgi:hypothetical protein